MTNEWGAGTSFLFPYLVEASGYKGGIVQEYIFQEYLYNSGPEQD